MGNDCCLFFLLPGENLPIGKKKPLPIKATAFPHSATQASGLAGLGAESGPPRFAATDQVRPSDPGRDARRGPR
jgi:hypothetical protein